MAVTYRVVHRTDYRYTRPVSPSYGQLYVLPRDLDGQTCVDARIAIDPPPDDYRERSDFFGNRAAFYAIQAPHRRLSVTAESTVVVSDRVAPSALGADEPWEAVRDQLRAERGDDWLDARQYVLESPLVTGAGALADYALDTFAPGRGLVEGLSELSERIHAEFGYEPGATTVSSRVGEVFATRKGVCQDFAHVGIGCLRAIGLPARYVSGYLANGPPDDGPGRAGGDESHAWFSVFAGAAGWVDVDPTHAQFIDRRYVTTAWGRDYSDVPPLNGIIYTEGTTDELSVSVNVRPLP
jgi:transglutaminase-like putative cysteine protease